ncbi:linear amide C-N hydrolase [Paenochrobactrum pullorum]|uniref:linear amide C-N hydrolase n=1 Tax=Paenochrobactrum pullorum TaxID=1324351 RepID=UPI0035BC4CEC
MCTRVLWSDTQGLVIVGRNMDFHKDLMTNLWTQPRGIERNDGVYGDLKWTSQYGSVVATCFDMISVDGVNEAGLAGHILWLTESDYGEINQDRPKLSQAIWLQYFLDNFATVAQAVAWVKETNVQVVQMKDPTGGVAPALHLAIEDATGDSCIIEYVAGNPVVYHSADYKVMTNSPTYDQQLKILKEINGFGGSQPLPGSTKATDRFARASYYVSRLPEAKNQVQAVASMLSIMRNTAQPFRIPDPEAPEASQTLWQTIIDLTNKRYVFESTTRPNIVWVDLKDLNFSEGSDQMKLNLVDDLAIENGIVSEVSKDFSSAVELKFLTVT